MSILSFVHDDTLAINCIQKTFLQDIHENLEEMLPL